MKNGLKDLFYLHKSVARSVANWVRMVGTVGTLHGYGTQYLTYVPKCRTYVPMYRTMRTLFTVPVLLSKPYLKKVANRALLLKIDNLCVLSEMPDLERMLSICMCMLSR